MAYIEPNLRLFEKKIYSQLADDGVIEKVSENLGIVKGTFFEFGIGPVWQRPIEEGLEGNFVLLRERGWTGVFLDGSEYPHQYGVRREIITPLNINTLYRKHALPDDLDFMSIDVDGQEFWIWMALQYRPKVVILEYNGGLGPEASVTIQFDVEYVWDGTRYHGSSLRALDKLARSKFYTLVYANGVNAMFIRDDLVSNREDFLFDHIFHDCASHSEDTKLRAFVKV